MKILKLIGFFVVLISVTAIQAQQKKSSNEKRAVKYTEYISVKMELKKEQKTFLYEVLLHKYKSNSEKIKNKNLSQEDKKLVYKESYTNTNTKLLEKFSKKEVSTINKLIKEMNKESKK